MTAVMEAPTRDDIDDGLSDRWEFEGYGVRQDVFPIPVRPRRLRFEIRIEVQQRTEPFDLLRLYRNDECVIEVENERLVKPPDVVGLMWEFGL